MTPPMNTPEEQSISYEELTSNGKMIVSIFEESRKIDTYMSQSPYGKYIKHMSFTDREKLITEMLFKIRLNKEMK